MAASCVCGADGDASCLCPPDDEQRPAVHQPPDEHPGNGQAAADGGAKLLDDVEAFHRRLVAYPSESTRVAAVLWDAHAHAVESFESTPRLAHLSPEPASGKTRALEVHAVLVPEPMHAVNATPAALFRAVGDSDRRPTLLFDEVDTVFGPKAKDNEELRALLNAGHRRSGVAYRCVGEGTRQRVVAFPAYAALVVAGLGDLPDTIMSRAVVIRMRRRAPDEHVEAYRARVHEPEGHALRDRLARWAAVHHDVWRLAVPDMPDGVTDRPADVWEPLLAVADTAGGDWPARARDACRELTTPDPGQAASLGLQLLADVRDVFADADRLATEELLRRLRDLEESPWGDLRGKPLDARGLAWRLAKYEVQPGQVWLDGANVRGYRRDDLHDAWARYLPPAASPLGALEPLDGQAPAAPDRLPLADLADLAPNPGGEAGNGQAPAAQPDDPDGTDGTDGRPSTACAGCRLPLDPVLVEMGRTTHHPCEELP